MYNDDKSQIYLEIAENILAALDGRSAKEKYGIVAKLLKVTEKAVYNKFNGKSKFTIEEIVILAQKTKMSLDQLLLKSSVDKSYIPFYSDGLKYPPRAYHEFLANINFYFGKIKTFGNAHGHFLANELPLFHFLGFPQLMYLKLYIWNTTNWNIPGYSKEYKPDTLLNMPEFSQESNNLIDAFRGFASSEIWNPSILHNTLDQFRYLRDKGDIQDKNIIEGCRYELNSLINKLEDLTETGKKPVNRQGQVFDCNIYLTGLNMGSEIIIVKSDSNTILFQQLDVPNYLRTTDERMIDKAWSYYTNIKKTATHITESGDKEKTQLFKHLRASIDKSIV